MTTPIAATYATPPIYRSQALANWPTYKNFPLARRGFGVPGEDQLFAVSLPLPNKKLCSLEVTMRLRRLGRGAPGQQQDRCKRQTRPTRHA